MTVLNTIMHSETQTMQDQNNDLLDMVPIDQHIRTLEDIKSTEYETENEIYYSTIYRDCMEFNIKVLSHYDQF